MCFLGPPPVEFINKIHPEYRPMYFDEDSEPLMVTEIYGANGLFLANSSIKHKTERGHIRSCVLYNPGFAAERIIHCLPEADAQVTSRGVDVHR